MNCHNSRFACHRIRIRDRRTPVAPGVYGWRSRGLDDANEMLAVLGAETLKRCPTSVAVCEARRLDYAGVSPDAPIARLTAAPAALV